MNKPSKPKWMIKNDKLIDKLLKKAKKANKKNHGLFGVYTRVD